MLYDCDTNIVIHEMRQLFQAAFHVVSIKNSCFHVMFSNVLAYILKKENGFTDLHQFLNYGVRNKSAFLLIGVSLKGHNCISIS